MFPVKSFLNISYANQANLSSQLGVLPDGSSPLPKSPKINELRARHEALQKPENDLKQPKFEKA